MNLNKHGDYKKKFKKTWPDIGGMKEKNGKETPDHLKAFSVPTPPPKACPQIDKALLARFPSSINYIGIVVKLATLSGI